MIEVNRRPQDTAGYCAHCNKLVVRDASAGCSAGGHGPQSVRGLVDLNADGEIPYQLPRFNWAAALFPALWGPVHGVWAGAVVFPLLIFMDNALRVAASPPPDAADWLMPVIWFVTSLIVAGTLALMYNFGKMGWGIAWVKANEAGLDALPQNKPPEDSLPEFKRFLARERRWFPASLLLFASMIALAVYWWTMR